SPAAVARRCTSRPAQVDTRVAVAARRMSRVESRATKNPARAGSFATRRPAGPGDAGSGCLERLDARGEAALVAGGLVLVDQAAGAETVEDRLRDVEGFLGAGGVVGFERLEHFLDGGA